MAHELDARREHIGKILDDDRSALRRRIVAADAARRAWLAASDAKAHDDETGGDERLSRSG